ncbi:MAG TPA: HesA/MoeB/ThiF family protein [Candidatus Azoamicus sp. OHIO2]
MYALYSRYLRHIVLPEFGLDTQDILIKSKILCIGAGGLGSPALTYLAMLGVGTIDIIDYDFVEQSNLNRQFLFNEKDIGKNKALCAKNFITNLNTTITVNAYDIKLSYDNCFFFLKNYNVILDCTDNLDVKFLISDCGIKLNIPVVHAGIFGFEGYISIFSKETYCYRCIYDKITSPQCIDYGVYGPIAGIIGIMQANETIKLLLNAYTLLKSHLFFFDLKNLTVKSIAINKNSSCIIC